MSLPPLVLPTTARADLPRRRGRPAAVGRGEGVVERMLSQAALRAAWEHVRTGGGIAGADRESAERFGRDLDRRLLALAEAVRAGAYAPLPALAVRIPKDRRSGERELAVPAIEDRVLQRAFLDSVGDLVDRRFLPCSHGYRPGGSVRNAVRAVRRALERRPWVADADIRDFFGTVPHDRLLDEMAQWVDDPEALRLVRLWLQTPVLRGAVVERPERGLPLGSPLSPLLSNVFLHRLDLGLWRPDQVYVRFADDFVVCCSTRPAADSALQAAREILSSLGLELAEEKSSVVDARSSALVFLGHLVRSQGRRSRAEREVPTVRTLYLTDPGAQLVKRGGRFAIERDGSVVLEVPTAKVREVHVFGGAGLTTPAMVECLKRSIDVVFLSSRGRYAGRLQAWESKNPLVRQAQYEAARDPEASLELARAFVSGKIANQRRLFQRQAAKSDAPELAAIKARLKPLPKAVEKARNLDTLRSIEGQASRCLFDALPHFLHSDFGFTGRRRRPPTDPVNSLLSFGYTLLTHELVSAVATAGLDPYIGFLHFAKYGRASVALDLVEEFRPIVVDTLVLAVLNRRILTAEDFFRSDGAVLLRDDPRRTFLREYEHRMLTLFTYEPTGERISYRRALLVQARQLVRVLQEPDAAYVPVLLT